MCILKIEVLPMDILYVHGQYKKDLSDILFM